MEVLKNLFMHITEESKYGLQAIKVGEEEN